MAQSPGHDRQQESMDEDELEPEPVLDRRWDRLDPIAAQCGAARLGPTETPMLVAGFSL